MASDMPNGALAGRDDADVWISPHRISLYGRISVFHSQASRLHSDDGLIGTHCEVYWYTRCAVMWTEQAFTAAQVAAWTPSTAL